MRRLLRPERVRLHPRTQVIRPDPAKYREPTPKPIRFHFEAHIGLSAFIQVCARLVSDGGGNSSFERPSAGHFRPPCWSPLRLTR